MSSALSTPTRTALAAVVIGAALTGSAGTAAAQVSLSRYVALGDSYASGAGVPDQLDRACDRSSRSYPSLVTAALSPKTKVDVSCTAATTADLANTQSSSNGPQFDALTPDTDLVTLTIGGNDLGFTDLIGRCITLGLFAPLGSPCKVSYTMNGTDQLPAKIQATASKIAAVLDGIRQRSPRAAVLVTGYPVIAPDNGTNCFATVTIAKGDAPWLRDTAKRFNAAIAAQAADHGARYVDTYTPSIGHDVCAPSGTRWLEPLIANGAAAFHPNAAGQQSMATAVINTTR
ncbi:SGNH/GDSL hydrolase family protein [Streptomyces sp. NPDC059917]|uniref:SGNH/GDSL hydrolase family protein n=1 Tax=Streptomyces sp. NPDC059917 TaxID=3347002 RepID=UPI003669A376